MEGIQLLSHHWKNALVIFCGNPTCSLGVHTVGFGHLEAVSGKQKQYKLVLNPAPIFFFLQMERISHFLLQ